MGTVVKDLELLTAACKDLDWEEPVSVAEHDYITRPKGCPDGWMFRLSDGYRMGPSTARYAARLHQLLQRYELLAIQRDAQPNGSPMLTRSELVPLRALEMAWNGFLRLEVQHPDDLEEFRRALHRCQHLIGIRVARRAQPAYWYVEPTHA